MRKRLEHIALATLVAVVTLAISHPALACSVCFGDPNSAMNQGVQAGMLVLLGVIGGVLGLLASLMIFWMRRAAQLNAEVEAREKGR